MANIYLHDDGALLLLHCNDRSLLKEVDELANQYDMKLAKDWWVINELHLAFACDPSLTVNKDFAIYFLTICKDLGGWLNGILYALIGFMVL